MLERKWFSRLPTCSLFTGETLWPHNPLQTSRRLHCHDVSSLPHLLQVQPQLAYTARSRTVIDVLANMRLPVPLPGLSRDVFLGAGAALLPAWAVTMLGLTPADALRARIGAGSLRAMAPVFRAALNDGPAQRSCQRMGIDPARLRRPFA